MQTDISPKTSDREGVPLADYTLPETSMDYLEKMRILCASRGIELILVKAPTNTWGYWWYDEWDAQIVDYAERHGLAYYNMIDCADEIGIDWQTDTYDAGIHLNVYGAEKVSRWFGEILSGEHGIRDTRVESCTSTVWGQRLSAYLERKNQMEKGN